MVSVIDISDDYRGICLVADKDFAFESPTMRDAIRASYMLQQTSLPIADIAVRLHFSETASFTRFFTRMKGMNPRAYRAQTWHASHDVVPIWLQSQ